MELYTEYAIDNALEQLKIGAVTNSPSLQKTLEKVLARLDTRNAHITKVVANHACMTPTSYTVRCRVNGQLRHIKDCLVYAEALLYASGAGGVFIEEALRKHLLLHIAQPVVQIPNRYEQEVLDLIRQDTCAVYIYDNGATHARDAYPAPHPLLGVARLDEWVVAYDRTFAVMDGGKMLHRTKNLASALCFIAGFCNVRLSDGLHRILTEAIAIDTRDTASF